MAEELGSPAWGRVVVVVSRAAEPEERGGERLVEVQDRLAGVAGVRVETKLPLLNRPSLTSRDSIRPTLLKTPHKSEVDLNTKNRAVSFMQRRRGPTRDHTRRVVSAARGGGLEGPLEASEAAMDPPPAPKDQTRPATYWPHLLLREPSSASALCTSQKSCAGVTAEKF